MPPMYTYISTTSAFGPSAVSGLGWQGRAASCERLTGTHNKARLSFNLDESSARPALKVSLSARITRRTALSALKWTPPKHRLQPWAPRLRAASLRRRCRSDGTRKYCRCPCTKLSFFAQHAHFAAKSGVKLAAQHVGIDKIGIDVDDLFSSLAPPPPLMQKGVVCK